MALSVDTLEDSKALSDKLGVTFPLLSDPEQAIVKAFGVYDPGNEIAWPFIFIIDKDGKIVWRKYLDEYKVRPPIKDILDAVDAARKP